MVTEFSSFEPKKARIKSSKLETIRTSLLIKLTQQQVRLFRADQ